MVLAAAFALSAVASASASAATEPALWECAKAPEEVVKWEEEVKGVMKKKEKEVYTGKYKEAKCKTLDEEDKYRIKGEHPGPEGKYELQEWTKYPKAFTKITFGHVEIDAPSGFLVCPSGSTAAGELTGPKTVGNLVITFRNCEDLSYGGCSSAEAKVGEIRTKVLDGELGYRESGSKAVGLDLKGQSSEYMAEFKCGALPTHVVIKGSIVGSFWPVNTFTKKATLEWQRLGTTQLFEELEGAGKDTPIWEQCNGQCNPIGNGESPAALEATATVELSEELEIKA